MKKVALICLGTIKYLESLQVQKELFHFLKKNEEVPGFLVMVEHYPVYTFGKEGGLENLFYTRKQIQEMGIDIHEADRGGNITYHGPGQIIGYPILNLAKFNKDVRWYVDRIENVVILTLEKLDISAGRKDKLRGVWIGDEKICAVGIGVKKWITMHGFALNYNVNLEHFKLINPCGITQFGITTIEKINKKIKKDKVIQEIMYSFEEVFECKLLRDTEKEAELIYV